MDRPEGDVVAGGPVPVVEVGSEQHLNRLIAPSPGSASGLEATKELASATEARPEAASETAATAPLEPAAAGASPSPLRRLLSRVRPYVPVPVLQRVRKAWLNLQGVPSLPRAHPRQLPPHPWLKRPDGVVAVGGGLEVDRLLAAYGAGLFPWPGPDGTLLWHSPDPRFVVDLAGLKIPKETARLHRQGRFRITFDQRFDQVIEETASVPRKGGRGTWISAPLITAWKTLHRLGHAHSVEAWSGDQLVGGSYGLVLGAAYFGESSFSRANSAGAVAFAALFTHLRDRGFSFVDCQVRSSHLERFGQVGWSREEFLMRLYDARERRLEPIVSSGLE